MGTQAFGPAPETRRLNSQGRTGRQARRCPKLPREQTKDGNMPSETEGTSPTLLSYPKPAHRPPELHAMRCNASTALLQGLFAQPQVPTALLSPISTDTQCLGRGRHHIPTPCGNGRGKGRKRKSEDETGTGPQQAGSSAPAASKLGTQRGGAAALGHSPGAGCQQSTEQEGSCTKKHISLLKAGHLATLMKSALVSGSVLSTLFYFCPRASFSYYKQDFQS